MNLISFVNKILVLSGVSFFVSCELDYENRNSITSEGVWTDRTMIYAYLNDIHGSLMPGWASGSDDCDESMDGIGSMSDYARGVIDAEKDGKGFDYGSIDKINFFLMQLEHVPGTVLTEEEKRQLKGQALFWRAWDYWGKVNIFGGVPLITEWQNVNDRPSLFIPRSSTTDCFNQIIADLDSAIEYLPTTWNDENWGRIDKLVAMSYKGRLLMNYASPLFNRNQDVIRWEKAYEANKQALDALKAAGKGLYPSYAGIWKDKWNEEAVMVNPYFYPGHSTSAYMWKVGSYPIAQMLLAYPQRDGSPLTLEVSRLSDPSYNADFLDRFYNNRDDRFSATIFSPGTHYPSADDAPGCKLEGGQNYWSTWQLVDGNTYNSMIFDQWGESDNHGPTGFRCVKGNDESKNSYNQGEGETDWIEIRYAEVLMNFAECANEIGKTEEALDVIYQIRKRAGIEPGSDNRYGVKATSREAVREALINERFVEFAFEGKRWGDLRRWMRWDKINAMKHRSSIHIIIKNNVDLETFDWTWNMKDKSVRDKFYVKYIENVDMDDKFTFAYDLNHWFYPIAKNDLDRNSKLEQNNEWGGTFDPLK